MGSSLFLARNANALFKTNFFTEQSGPGLLETRTGWGMLTSWHTIYLWLSSDVGFIGAIVLLGLLSYLFGLVWADAIFHGLHWAIILAYMMILLFIYIPANNQIFQSGESWFCFYITVMLWLWARGKREHRRASLHQLARHRRALERGRVAGMQHPAQ
jgi:hypothetical protein